MAKKVWLTWLADIGSHNPDDVAQKMMKNGLQVYGSPWVDDLAKMAWVEVAELLLKSEEADIWVIAGDKNAFELESNRYALSLLTATVQSQRGMDLSMVILALDFAPEVGFFPTLLQVAELLSFSDAGWPAKVVASSYVKQNPVTEYRFGVRANVAFGTWFEIGPINEIWEGAMFGVPDNINIALHAVGPQGVLPERTVLEYQTKDMKATIGDTQFTVWSVQNKIEHDFSYYVKIDGYPNKIVFAGNPGLDQSEVNVLTLK